MIIGIGNDLVNIERIERTYETYGQRFLDRMFSSDEQAYCLNKRDVVARLAKHWAAKEAGAKAIGTGFSGGVSWRNISVSHDENGRPLMIFSGQALRTVEHLCSHKPFKVHLSLSDDHPFASAYVIIERVQS